MFDIDLIHYQYGILHLMFFDDIRIDMLFFGGNTDAVIDHKEDKIRIIYNLFDEHFLFLEIHQARTIEKRHLADVVDQSLVFYNISGGSRNVRHYRSELSDKPIEERRFPDIGGAD